MRIARSLVVSAALAGLPSLPLMAQQVNASGQQSASASAAGTHVNQSADAGANASASRGPAGARGAGASSLSAQSRHGSANADANGWAAGDAQMRRVTGELQGKLDSKTAKVGEPVVLKTRDKIKTADGVVIPRGSRLIGHVTEVQAHARGHQQSRMGMVFDRAELKNGQSFAIHSVIGFVGPAGGGAISGGGAAVGGAGGGLLGGGAGVVGGASSAVGGVGSGVASNAAGAFNAGGNAVGATGNLAGNAAANVGRGVSGSAGGAGALGAHATAIPGVMLSSGAAAGASGMFTAARRNIHFDSGTQMVLGVAAAK